MAARPRLLPEELRSDLLFPVDACGSLLDPTTHGAWLNIAKINIHMEFLLSYFVIMPINL